MQYINKEVYSRELANYLLSLPGITIGKRRIVISRKAIGIITFPHLD